MVNIKWAELAIKLVILVATLIVDELSKKK